MTSPFTANPSKFLSTPSARRATCVLSFLSPPGWISIHALREEGDEVLCRCHKRCHISIHALREEGDLAFQRRPAFYPGNFYPRPPRGGRRQLDRVLAKMDKISIHALREEGDRSTGGRSTSPGYFYPRPPRGGRLMCAVLWPSTSRFLSTPSARRATRNVNTDGTLNRFLSTPSARRATSAPTTIGSARRNFYPRPPRGGRRNTSYQRAMADIFLSTPSARRATHLLWFRDTRPQISIHALREEGDVRCRTWRLCHKLFLSTPSARRATAKTETKSLFSNKLYNILHEFRRALIYNGSKNYPNHAK